MSSAEPTPELVLSIPHGSSNRSSQFISSQSTSPFTNYIAPATPSLEPKRTNEINPAALAFTPANSVKRDSFGLVSDKESQFPRHGLSQGPSTAPPTTQNTPFWTPQQTPPVPFSWTWASPFSHVPFPPPPWDVHGQAPHSAVTSPWFPSPAYSYPGASYPGTAPFVQPWHSMSPPYPFFNCGVPHPHTHSIMPPPPPASKRPATLSGQYPPQMRPQSCVQWRGKSVSYRSRRSSGSAAQSSRKSSLKSLDESHLGPKADQGTKWKAPSNMASSYAVAASQSQSKSTPERDGTGNVVQDSLLNRNTSKPNPKGDAAGACFKGKEEIETEFRNQSGDSSRDTFSHSNAVNQKGSWSQSMQWTSSGKKELEAFQRLRLDLRYMGADKSPFIPTNVMDFATFRIQIADDRKTALSRKVTELLAQLKNQLRPTKVAHLCFDKLCDDGLSPLFAMDNCFSYSVELADLTSTIWPTVKELKQFHAEMVGSGKRPLPPPKVFEFDFKTYQDCLSYVDTLMNSYYILPVDNGTEATQVPGSIEPGELPWLTRDLIDFIDQYDAVFTF